MIDKPKRYTVKSTFGSLTLTARRKTEELLTHFLSHYDEPNKNLAIIIREAPHAFYWCPGCKEVCAASHLCRHTTTPPYFFPALTKQTVKQLLEARSPLSQITILTSEELIHYTRYDASLVMGFDVFLSIIDFRASTYLVTLLYLIASQSQETLFVTSNQDAWTQLTNKTIDFFLTTELEVRKEQLLPPFSLAVLLTSNDKKPLEDLKSNLPEEVIRAGSMRKHVDGYALSLLFKSTATIPNSWHRKKDIRVDIMPNYVE